MKKVLTKGGWYDRIIERCWGNGARRSLKIEQPKIQTKNLVNNFETRKVRKRKAKKKALKDINIERWEYTKF